MFLSLYFIVTSACIEREIENSCEEYVEYMCSCHARNPNYNCADLTNMYRDARGEKPESCALSLDDQIFEDTKNKLKCELKKSKDMKK